MGAYDILFILMGILPVVFFYKSLSCLIELREEWWRRFLLLFGSWFLMFMVIFIGDIANLPPTILIFLFCFWNASKGSGLKKLTIGLMFASIMLAFNGLCDNCIEFFVYKWSVPRFVWRLIFALLLYLGVHKQKANRDFELAPSLWKLLLMLCMAPLGIVFSLVLLTSPFIDSSTVILSNMSLFIIAIFSFVGILRSMIVLNRHQNLEREIALAEQNKKYYEAMEQQQFEIRRLKHDLANHLQILLTLPPNEKNKYIQKMIENPAFEKVLSYSGDATVNAVLTAKESLMRQKEIQFYAKIDIPNELPFEKPDICALFANALDNAADGCASLPVQKRQVELTARAAKGILAVEIKNSCKEFDEENKEKLIRYTNKLPKTTKSDSVNHGYGLKSIQEIVKKYHGNMELKQENGSFCLFCFLPEN